MEKFYYNVVVHTSNPNADIHHVRAMAEEALKDIFANDETVEATDVEVNHN